MFRTRRRFRGLSSSLLMKSGLLFIVLMAPVAARADLQVFITNPTTAAGATGSFDILLTNMGGSSVSMSGFDIAVEVASDSGLSFTGANTSIKSPYTYIFGTEQNGSFFDPSNNLNTYFKLIGSDYVGGSYVDSSAPQNLGYQTLGAGQTFGLAHVSYTLSSSTPVGPIAVTFIGDSTDFLDSTFNTILLPNPQGGTITVTAAAIPEPGSLVMAGLLTICGGLLTVRGAKAKSPAITLRT